MLLVLPGTHRDRVEALRFRSPTCPDRTCKLALEPVDDWLAAATRDLLHSVLRRRYHCRLGRHGRGSVRELGVLLRLNGRRRSGRRMLLRRWLGLPLLQALGSGHLRRRRCEVRLLGRERSGHWVVVGEGEKLGVIVAAAGQSQRVQQRNILPLWRCSSARGTHSSHYGRLLASLLASSYRWRIVRG